MVTTPANSNGIIGWVLMVLFLGATAAPLVVWILVEFSEFRRRRNDRSMQFRRRMEG